MSNSFSSIVLFAAVVLAAVVPALCQTPMSVVKIEPGEAIHALSPVPPSGAGTVVRLTNLSEKSIAAYVLVLRTVDSQGSAIGRHILNPVLVLDPNDARNAKKPGDTWVDVFRRTPGTAATVDVDYVLFTDGTSWGPDSEKMSLRIAGMREGYRAGLAVASKTRQ
jgi:hypothetical protein